MRTRDDLADGSSSSEISIRRIGGMCERERKEKRKDNAEARSSRRCAEEDGFTGEDTEGSYGWTWRLWMNSMMSCVEVPGRKISAMPDFLSAAMSGPGMMPPTRTVTSSMPFS